MLSNFSSEFDLLTLVFSEYQFQPLLTNLGYTGQKRNTVTVEILLYVLYLKINVQRLFMMQRVNFC